MNRSHKAPWLLPRTVGAFLRIVAASSRRPAWLLPLAVGAFLRIVAAFSGHGWFAPDDYEFAVQQGGDWLRDPAAPFASAIRSPLLSWFFAGTMRACEAFGVPDPAARLHWVYALLGLWSLLAVPPTWLLARRRLGDAAARQAAWLVAAFALMPRIATRGLIEVMAVPWLMWALVAAERAASGPDFAVAPSDDAAGFTRQGSSSPWLRFSQRSGRAGRLDNHAVTLSQARATLFVYGSLAGLLLGAACLLRFQLGIFFAAFAVYLVWPFRRGERDAGKPSRHPWVAFCGLCFGGAVAGSMQALIDAHMGRAPFGTIAAYLSFNDAHAASYGTSSWYIYLGHFALYSVPPATLWLARPFWRAARAAPFVAACLGWFVLVHACIGHKEDRFMYSVLPLFFVLLGGALAEARGPPGAATAGGRPLRAGASSLTLSASVRLREARGPGPGSGSGSGSGSSLWERRAFVWFWAVNTLALGVSVFSDAQRNLTVPLLHVARQPAGQALAAVGYSTLPRYYAGEATEIAYYPDAEAFLRDGRAVDWVLIRPAAQGARIAQALPRCAMRGEFAGDFADRLVLALNPKHNGRRAPTVLLACSATAAADSANHDQAAHDDRGADGA